jgi:hypothetical protein
MNKAGEVPGLSRFAGLWQAEQGLFSGNRSTCPIHLEEELRNALDIVNNGSSIEISPPIHFRIEWAGSQEMFTASWRLAHLNFIHRFGRQFRDVRLLSAGGAAGTDLVTGGENLSLAAEVAGPL